MEKHPYEDRLIWQLEQVHNLINGPSSISLVLIFLGESILFVDSLKDDEFYNLYARRKMYLTK